ncbi:MAG: fluoride efflux transporter CrcB [Solirubrobacteraceae bacterium]
MSVWAWLGVALLGGVGANARFLVHTLVAPFAGDEFPFGTLLVNASGSLVLGLLVGFSLSGVALVLAGTATLGSYTTFSTWLLETEWLAARGQRVAVVLNLLVSLALGLGAVALGRAIASQM